MTMVKHANLGVMPCNAPPCHPCAQVLAHLDVLLPSLFDALSAPSDRVVAEALSVQAAIAADDPAQFRALMTELLDRCALLAHVAHLHVFLQQLSRFPV